MHGRKQGFGRVSSKQVCRTDGCACSFVGLLASVKHASGKLIKPPQHVLKLCPRYAGNVRKRVRLLLIRLPRSRARLKLVGWLLACLNVPATCYCISGTGVLGQVLRAATLRQKSRIKLSTSPSRSILTPGQPVPALSLYAGQPLARQFLSHWYDSTRKKSTRRKRARLRTSWMGEWWEVLPESASSRVEPSFVQWNQSLHLSPRLCPSVAGCSPPSMPSIVFCLLLSCFTFHLGFVHPLQGVATCQCLPLSSVYCFPVPGGSPLLCYVVLPSSTWSCHRLESGSSSGFLARRLASLAQG